MSLVVADKTLIEVAERTIKKYNIVPLYYNMKKAEPRILTKESIYEGLQAAFTGSNIGMYSNAISKIWNSDIFINGTVEEQVKAINAVKYLCCENNFCIDRAKTLYMPTRPQWVNAKINQFTKKKLPYFFTYAKDKTENQVEERNGSLVNKLYDIIPNPRISYKKVGLESVDYKLLMDNPNIDLKVVQKHGRTLDKAMTEPLIVKYLELSKKYSYQINSRLMDTNIRLPLEIALNSKQREYVLTGKWIIEIIKELENLKMDKKVLVDKLVKFLYGKNNSMHVELLWLCFGSQLYDNLKKNLYLIPKEKKHRRIKSLECIDCGEWFTVDISNSKTHRCKACQHEFDKKRKREWKRRNQSRLNG